MLNLWWCSSLVQRENWYYLGRKSEKIRFSSEAKTVVQHLFEFSLSAIINKWNAKGQHLHLVFDHVTWLTMLGTKLWSICWHAMSIQFTLLAKQVAIAENVAENWSQVEPAAMLPRLPQQCATDSTWTQKLTLTMWWGLLLLISTSI